MKHKLRSIINEDRMECELCKAKFTYQDYLDDKLDGDCPGPEVATDLTKKFFEEF